MNKVLLIAVLVLVGAGSLCAQNKRKELERKKASLVKEIQYQNKLLQETSRNKKNSLNELVLLNKKIGERKELITTIKTELSLLEEEIEENTYLIEAMQSDIEILKEEYARMIRFAYRNRNNYDKIMYVFAARDFDQAYKRLRYLQEYTEYRKRQAKAIQRLEETLRAENEALTEKKAEKQALLQSEDEEQQSLAQEKDDQQRVYSELQKREKELKKAIKKKQKEQRTLQAAIERIIAEAVRESGGSTAKAWNLTPEAQALANNFTSNKGKLPWPVERGVITDKYGLHAHPVLKQIKIFNNGVTISTEAGSVARAVFDGEVSKVIVIPGAGKAVIVRHGDYLTVYGNLGEVYVSSGDKITTKQKIGRVLSEQGKTELQFEIRKGQDVQTLDPAFWLYGAR